MVWSSHSQDNQGQGSIVWIAHGTVLYRCAPEQLRHVTQQLSDIHEHVSHGTVFEEIRRAGTKANFKNIATEIMRRVLIPEGSNPAQALQVPLVRARFKQSNHVNRELAAGTGVAQENAPPDQGGEQQRSLCRDDGHRQGDEPARTGQPADAGRPLQGPDMPRSPRDRPGIRPLAESASSLQSQVSGRKGVCSPQPAETQRPETSKISQPKAQPKAGYPKLPEKNSGAEPTPSDDEEWGDQSPGQAASSKSEMMTMMTTIIVTFQDLSVKINQLRATSESQQVAMHHTVGMMNQLQKSQQEQNMKMAEMKLRLHSKGYCGLRAGGSVVDLLREGDLIPVASLLPFKRMFGMMFVWMILLNLLVIMRLLAIGCS